MTGKTKYDLDRGNHVVYSLHYLILPVFAIVRDRTPGGDCRQYAGTK